MVRGTRKENLDKEFITVHRDTCLKVIKMLKVATAEGIHDFLKKREVVERTSQQIAEIFNSMILDNAVIEVKSTGLGECHSIPVGSVCYRTTSGVALGADPKTIAPMASIPCGACSRISQCTPNGDISPTNVCNMQFCIFIDMSLLWCVVMTRNVIFGNFKLFFLR